MQAQTQHVQGKQEKGEGQTFENESMLARCRAKPEQISLNEIYQDGQASACGYCNQKDGSFSWSFTKKTMDSYTYQLFMERGWRRCGTYFYKPNLAKSCCKLFSHRLQVERFRIKKDQKKAVKKVIMLAYDKVDAPSAEAKGRHSEHDIKNRNSKSKIQVQKEKPAELLESVKQQLQTVCKLIVEYLKANLSSLIKGTMLDQASFQQFNYDISNKLKFFTSKAEDVSDHYSNLVMLVFGLNKKLIGNAKYSLVDFAKDVKAGIESLNPVTHFKVEVERGGYLLFKRLPREMTNQFEILGEREHLKEKQQKIESELAEQKEEKDQKEETGLSTIISKIKSKFKKQQPEAPLLSKEDKNSNNFELLKPEHQYKGEINISFNRIVFGKLTIEIVKAEDNLEGFKLYQDYCTKIHQKPEKNMSAYVDFLCLRALDYREEQSKIKEEDKGLYVPSWDPSFKYQKAKAVSGEVKKLVGCYHMKYFFKGKLIGIGVVDMVDEGLSSVYFFYDPKYKEHRLGVFSSIIEIEYVRWMRLSFPQFRYYYMGFYVSNSEKMNYKVDYMPCQLLCPVTYQFIDFDDEVKERVNRIEAKEEKDMRLTEKEAKVIEDMAFGRDLGPYIDKNVKLVYNGKRLVLREINPHFFLHILKILQANMRGWGKTIFEMLAFTL